MFKKYFTKSKLLVGVALATGIPVVDGCVEEIRDFLEGLGLELP
jgi:hypothetical protein